MTFPMSQRSFQVVKGHRQFFGNNFNRDQLEDENALDVFRRRYGSTDIQYDLFRLSHDLDLGLDLGQIFCMTF